MLGFFLGYQCSEILNPGVTEKEVRAMIEAELRKKLGEYGQEGGLRECRE